jgi:hypothetical protein
VIDGLGPHAIERGSGALEVAVAERRLETGDVRR